MSVEQLQAKLAALEIAAAKASEERDQALKIIEEQNKSNKKGQMKVGEKGGLSFNHGGRFPVTLYADQWTYVLDNADRLRDFMKKNKVLNSSDVKRDSK